jgi:hypothetical protein
MKYNSKKFLSNALIHGLYLGGISIVLTVIYYVFDISIFNWVFSIFRTLLSITLSVIFMVIAIKKYRIGFLDGNIKYLQCVLIGLIVIMLSGILSSLFSYILNNFIDPDMMKKQLDLFIEKMQSYNIPEEKLNEIIEKTSKSIDPSSQLRNYLIYVPCFSVVVSFIVSIFVRKKDNTFESNFK